jgi:hypothetical protein
MRSAALTLIAALAGSSVLVGLAAEALRAEVAQTTTKPPAATTKKPAPRPTTRKPATAKPLPPVTEPATVNCPVMLGEGARDGISYCDVVIGRDPAGGILIPFPPHQGPVTVTFNLHNRHTYSEEQIKANRAYHRYTATIGVLALDNTLLSRFYVQNEFRAPADLVDRIRGGSGPGGLKAVAPTGTEPITIVVTEDDAKDGVSILGDRLSVARVDGSDTFTAPGRPIAVISNVMLEYRPAPAKPAPARRR